MYIIYIRIVGADWNTG